MSAAKRNRRPDSELQTVSETLEAALRYGENEWPESAVGEWKTFFNDLLRGSELSFVELSAEPNINVL